MNNFVYDIPTKIYFGPNQLHHLKDELKKFGNKVLLTYGSGSIKKSGLYDLILKELEEFEIYECANIAPNPRIESVREGAQICKEKKIDVLLAVGGGSVMDATKFMAAGACVDFDPWDFFSKNAPIHEALPICTIVTLAATGSEMDRGGVISNMNTNEKIARSSELVRPKVSFLDPTLTYSVSKYQTACGSADILSHLMEVYFNLNDTMFMLDGMIEAMMKTVMKYAPIALEKPEDYEARANLMYAASWAINGFVKAGDGVGWSCHQMEHELSAFYDITHGLGLAIVTPRWMEYCLNSDTMYRYVNYGINVLGIDASLRDEEIAKLSIEKTADFFFNKLGLTSNLHDLGIDDTYFEKMAYKACNGKSFKGFIELSQQDIVNILKMCE